MCQIWCKFARTIDFPSIKFDMNQAICYFSPKYTISVIVVRLAPQIVFLYFLADSDSFHTLILHTQDLTA